MRSVFQLLFFGSIYFVHVITFENTSLGSEIVSDQRASEPAAEFRNPNAPDVTRTQKQRPENRPFPQIQGAPVVCGQTDSSSACANFRPLPNGAPSRGTAPFAGPNSGPPTAPVGPATAVAPSTPPAGQPTTSSPWPAAENQMSGQVGGPETVGQLAHRTETNGTEFRDTRPYADFNGPLKPSSGENVSKSGAADGSGQLTVDGCSGKIQFGYGKTGCSSLKMHKALADQINKYMMNCIKSASGIDSDGIFIHHVGCYNYRKMRGGNSLSMHAFARAIDIIGIEVRGGSGTTSYSMDRSKAQQPFYNQLRSCWKKSLSDAGSVCGQGYAGGTIGYVGSLGTANALHNDHLHVECPP